MELEVYKITNKVNGKIYIGITNQGANTTRWYKHCSDANVGSTFPLHNAIRKYGKENFQIEVIEIVDDVEVLKEREIYWIKYYDSYNRKKGYNLTLGGDGTFGRFHSEETKEKIRQKAIGRKLSEDVKEKFRNRTNVNKQILQISLNNEILNLYKSVAEASRQLGKNRHVISHCAKGHRKTAYGYKWMYLEDLEIINEYEINVHEVFERFNKKE